MLVFPNAKINLGLDVVEKRSDGFHNIETIFYPIKLCDVLEIVETSKAESSLTNSGIQVDGDTKNNLCMRALRLIKNDFKIPEVDIFLHKKIPYGAGLGGGSSDAANVLKVLNEMFSLKIGDKKLAEYASQLGSDCAFFIYNKPMMASGRGEIMHPVDVNLSGYFLVLIKPDVAVSTAIAYSKVKPQQPKMHISEIIKRHVETWNGTLKNDFETSVFAEFPEIEKIKQDLYAQGAIYAAMSGSGSSVFGIFKNKINIEVFENKYFAYAQEIQ